MTKYIIKLRPNEPHYGRWKFVIAESIIEVALMLRSFVMHPNDILSIEEYDDDKHSDIMAEIMSKAASSKGDDHEQFF